MNSMKTEDNEDNEDAKQVFRPSEGVPNRYHEMAKFKHLLGTVFHVT